MTEPLHLACASGVDYAPHTAAMLHSALTWSGSRPLHVHYLHGPGFPADVQDRVRGMVSAMGGEIEFLEVDDEKVAKLPTRHEALVIPSSVWYRLQLPELLPHLDRILYLDGDIIVVDELEPLWTIDLGDHLLAAVTNVFEDRYAWRPAALGMDDIADYLNSGVILFNLEQMRREGTTAELWAYAHANTEKLMWLDQDVLSAVLGKRRLRLAPRWNVMNSVLSFPQAEQVFGAEAVREARERPAIRHFEGPSLNKPWHYLCPHDTVDLYRRHRRQTPWPKVELEGRTARTVLRRRLGWLRP